MIQQSMDQQQAHGVNRRGFNERRDGGRAHSTDSSNTNVPAVQDEPDDDREGEEGVEQS